MFKIGSKELEVCVIVMLSFLTDMQMIFPISGNKLSIIKKAWVVIKLILSEEGYVINKNKEMLSGPRSKKKLLD
ncbi:hypothetical protein CHE86_24445 [Salmonella enterica]|nr:hypothetical protein CHE86_24445 [Salmonella enterica]